ncbi:hypothetical protein HPY42_03540 [Coprothermobacteraceae bacterium]|nr:hypothetical protein [Coprothermobacteraceae bacterium]
MTKIVACGKSGLYDFLGMSGIEMVTLEEVENKLSEGADTIVFVSDTDVVKADQVTALEERYGSRFVPIILDARRGVDITSVKKFVEKAIGVKLDR